MLAPLGGSQAPSSYSKDWRVELERGLTQSVHDLLLSLDIGVEKSQDVLEVGLLAASIRSAPYWPNNWIALA